MPVFQNGAELALCSQERRGMWVCCTSECDSKMIFLDFFALTYHQYHNFKSSYWASLHLNHMSCVIVVAFCHFSRVGTCPSIEIFLIFSQSTFNNAFSIYCIGGCDGPWIDPPSLLGPRLRRAPLSWAALDSILHDNYSAYWYFLLRCRFPHGQGHEVWYCL